MCVSMLNGWNLFMFLLAICRAKNRQRTRRQCKNKRKIQRYSRVCTHPCTHARISQNCDVPRNIECASAVAKAQCESSYCQLFLLFFFAPSHFRSCNPFVFFLDFFSFCRCDNAHKVHNVIVITL